MKRRKRLPAEDRKREIVAGALRVFAQKGFDRATSRELAEAAGVSEALIYKYFPTKEALYHELASLLGGNKDRFVQHWTGQAPGAEALVRVLYGLSRMILIGPPGRPKDDSFDRLVGQSLLGDGTFAAAFFENLFFPIVPYLERCLEAAWRTGEIDTPSTPGQLECVLFHHSVGAIALFQLPPRPMLPTHDAGELHEASLRFSCRGLGLTEAALANHLDFERLGRAFEQTFAQGDPQ